MRITGDEQEGKAELDNFIDPESTYPVIATTSELMSTGVDAQTCKLIVLDQSIRSMTKFKQIIGRGTRINEAYGKFITESLKDYTGRTLHKTYASLDAFLDTWTHADEGIENLEDKAVLKVPPFSEIGTPVEIVRIFGGKKGFEEAVQGLQTQLYTK